MATRKPQGVYLQADTRVPYGQVVRVLAIIRGAGIQNVGLVAAGGSSAVIVRADRGRPPGTTVGLVGTVLRACGARPPSPSAQVKPVKAGPPSYAVELVAAPAPTPKQRLAREAVPTPPPEEKPAPVKPPPKPKPTKAPAPPDAQAAADRDQARAAAQDRGPVAPAAGRGAEHRDRRRDHQDAGPRSFRFRSTCGTS